MGRSVCCTRYGSKKTLFLCWHPRLMHSFQFHNWSCPPTRYKTFRPLSSTQLQKMRSTQRWNMTPDWINLVHNTFPTLLGQLEVEPQISKKELHITGEMDWGFNEFEYNTKQTYSHIHTHTAHTYTLYRDNLTSTPSYIIIVIVTPRHVGRYKLESSHWEIASVLNTKRRRIVSQAQDRLANA